MKSPWPMTICELPARANTTAAGSVSPHQRATPWTTEARRKGRDRQAESAHRARRSGASESMRCRHNLHKRAAPWTACSLLPATRFFTPQTRRSESAATPAAGCVSQSGSRLPQSKSLRALALRIRLILQRARHAGREVASSVSLPFRCLVSCDLGSCSLGS